MLKLLTYKDTQIERLASSALNNLEVDEVRVFLWHHSLTQSEIENYAKRLLSVETLEDATIYHGKRFIEKISIRLILCKLLGQHTQIMYQENGAPFLPNCDYHISISHTAGTYAISFSKIKHGIDIEEWSNTAQRVSKMFVNKHEASLLQLDVISTEKDKTYCTLWSAKEAIYKSTNLQGISFKEGIVLSKGATSNQLIAQILYKEMTLQGIIDYRLLTHCVLTVCIPTPF